jgi:hypothetical protein
MKPVPDCVTQRIKLLAQIESAFVGNDIPATAEIAAGDATQGQEYAYSQAFFGGRRWHDIEYVDILEAYPSGASAAVTFLSDQGFAFYLPLFMSCVLTKFCESGTLLESLLAELARSASPSGAKQFEARISLLNLSQKQCVAQFLSFLASCHSNDLPEDIYGRISPNVLLSDFWSDLLPPTEI